MLQRRESTAVTIGFVQAEEFVYPRYEVPLMEAYGGRFESAFIVLHPFIQVPEKFGWSALAQDPGTTQRYPSDEQIVAHGMKCPWGDVEKRTGISSHARMNQALLTSIGSLGDDFADPTGRDKIENFVKAHPVWMPAEGRFEPLLQQDFLDAFAAAGQEELVFVPEFPHSDPVVRLPISELKPAVGFKTPSLPFPSRGTLFPPDQSFLFTVEWDSFFTLFYGPRKFVAETARRRNLEGFFATPNTQHAWFNYSFGCAIVTVSPEDCPAA